MLPSVDNANTVLPVDAILAFAAALIRLRLSGDLVRRYRRRRAPELAAWAAGLGAYALAAGALAWGAAAGWSDAVFRVYYLCGALLTAALLGVGSLRLVGKRWIALVALVYVGVAVGVAVAVPLQADISGSSIPDAQDVLDLWPARALAITGNSVGTLAVVGVALMTFRARPFGNALIIAGIAVAGLGSALAGLGVAAGAPTITLAAVLLYVGFVAPSLPKPHRKEESRHGQRERHLDDRAGDPSVGH